MGSPLRRTRRVGVDELARLGDGVVADDDLPGEDERLRAAAAIGQPGVDDALVGALARALAHALLYSGFRLPGGSAFAKDSSHFGAVAQLGER